MHSEIELRLNFVWLRQPIQWICCVPTASVSRGVSSWRHLEDGHLPHWYWVWNTLQNCVLHAEVPCLLSKEHCAPQAWKSEHNYDPLVRSWLVVQGYVLRSYWSPELGNRSELESKMFLYSSKPSPIFSVFGKTAVSFLLMCRNAFTHLYTIKCWT